MIWAVVSEFLALFWPYIAGAALAVAGLRAARRSGVKAERAKQATAQAKAHTETIEQVLHETASDDPVADIRSRMRDRARKP